MNPFFERYFQLFNQVGFLFLIAASFWHSWATRHRVKDLGILVGKFRMPWSSGYASPQLHKFGFGVIMAAGLLMACMSILLLATQTPFGRQMADMLIYFVAGAFYIVAAVKLRGGVLRLFSGGLLWKDAVRWEDVLHYEWRFDSGKDVLVIHRRDRRKLPLRIICTCPPEDVATIAELMSRSASNVDGPQPRLPKPITVGAI